MEPGTFPEVSVSSADFSKMVYFFRGIADPDAIGKSVVSDNYSLVVQRAEGIYSCTKFSTYSVTCKLPSCS